MLVQNLTKKVGDGEEKYSLLKEQNDSFKELLVTERAQFEEKENMYKQNVSCTFRLWLNFIKLTTECFINHSTLLWERKRWQRIIHLLLYMSIHLFISSSIHLYIHADIHPLLTIHAV